MSYPRFQRARAFRRVSYTGGDITLNATAITAVQAGLDMTLEAQVGDQIEYGLSGLTSTSAQLCCFDVYTVVSATRVTPFTAGLSASLATATGNSGWYAPAVGNVCPVTGSIVSPALVSGDISAGQVTLGLYYAKLNTTARTLYANSDTRLIVWAKNLGPADD